MNSADFLSNLLDRKIYDVGATENLAVGLFDRKARPWPYSPVRASDTHFSCALFEFNTPKTVNDFRRSKDRWKGAIGVVLDDIGTKAKAPPVQPTAIIETSPGNQQWIYAFNRIVRKSDRALVETIQRSAIAAGMCDPEAKNITRITRLPDSLPKGKEYRAKLIWADWSRRFNPDVLIEKAFQVPVVKPPEPQPIGTQCLSDSTSPEGQGILERACHKIRNAAPGTIANTINAQAYFTGQAVGAGLIATADAEAALYSAASIHDRGEGHARNGLKAGIAKPLDRSCEIVTEAPAGEERSISESPTQEERQEAIAAHGRVVREWAANAVAAIEDDERDAPRVMLTGAQGVGKTAALVGRDDQPGALHDMAGKTVAMYFPTLDKAQEALEQYEQAQQASGTGGKGFVVRGRSARDPDTAGTMCLIPKTAEQVARQGGNVRRDLCKHCPLSAQCAYTRQDFELEMRKDSEAGLVVFASHEYAFLPLPGGVKPQAMVFDEQLSGMGAIVTRFKLEDLGNKIWANDPETRDQLDEHAHPLLKQIRNAAFDHPERMLAELREQGVTVKGLNTAISVLRDVKEGAISNAVQKATEGIGLFGANPERVEKSIAKHLPKQSRGLGSIIATLRALKDEIEAEYAAPIGVTEIETPDGKFIRAHRIRTARGRKLPFLHLDGTGEPELAQFVFGDMKHEHHPVPRNVIATYVTTHNFSNQGITGHNSKGELVWPEKAEQVRRKIKMGVHSMGGKPAIFSNKGVREALGLTDDPKAGHFGALRGKNSWEDADTGFVVGREQPSPRAIEDTARAFAVAAGATEFTPAGKFEEVRVAVTGAIDHRTGTIKTARHPDPWANRVLKQTRNAEVAQAIDRLRLIHNQEAKRIFILAPIDPNAIGVRVDHVLTLDEFARGGTRAEWALRAHSVLPLAARAAAELMPEIWKNLAAAQRDLAPLLSVSNGKRDILFTKRYTYEANVKWRPKTGWRARETMFLIDAEGPEAALAKLEALVEVIETDLTRAAEREEPPENAERPHIPPKPGVIQVDLKPVQAAPEPEKPDWLEAMSYSAELPADNGDFDLFEVTSRGEILKVWDAEQRMSGGLVFAAE